MSQPPAPAIVAPNQTAIAEAADLLAGGNLVAFPTETVYGLGADALNDRAIARIFKAKRRPRFNPLIVHFARSTDAREVVVFDERAERLASSLWPGPLSLVLARQPACRVSLLASAGLETLAVRVPDNDCAQALIEALGRPVAAPSANRSGQVSPTTAAHVAEGLGGTVTLILDSGPCPVGLESTVVDLTGGVAQLLRPGGVTVERIEAVIGPLAPADRGPPGPRAPGQLASHYAPDVALRLEATTVGPDEALLAFGPEPLQGATKALNLSPAGDLVEAAANLFAMLRALDRPDWQRIAVMPIPDHGLGLAVNDRLARAAAPRDTLVEELPSG